MGDKDDVVCYSVFLEKKEEQKTLNTTNTTNTNNTFNIQRKLYKWVDDDSVKSCYNCQKNFSLFIRRHHCRFCGKIFCVDCINCQAEIPKELLSTDSMKGTWNEYLSSYIFTKDPTKYKVCKSCFETIEFIDSVKKIIEIFIIIKPDVLFLNTAAKVCKSWNNASNYLLTIFREIQYKLPNSEYTELEKTLLWRNLDYLSGHSKYMLHLLKICQTEEERNMAISSYRHKKKVSCWNMMCSRNCCDKLTSFDAINLLQFGYKHNSNLLIKIALDYLICSDKEFKCYIPLLVYYLRIDTNGIISNFLIERCINNFNLLHSLYWELQLYNKESAENVYMDTIKKLRNLSKDKIFANNFVKLLESSSLVKVIENVGSAICEQNKKYEEIKDSFNLKGTLTCPLNHTVKVKNINVEKIKVKNSATKPLIIPCETSNNHIFNILYKKEDIRKDHIIMNMIQLIDLILKKEENLDLGITIYNVLPTSKDAGMIEVVNDCETIYHIQEKLKSSILNYILEDNGDMKVKEVRDNFIKSTASYCVITYILGIGDRHLDNIMVAKNGRLFHIDFGYILTKDPVLNDPGIRITPEIIEALGGLSSRYYKEFIELCSTIYNCLRRNIDVFMTMLSIIPYVTDVKITEDEINDLLIKRLIPGENKVDAKLHLVNQLEKTNYMITIKDWVHFYNKESSISSAMTRLTFAISNLITFDNKTK